MSLALDEIKREYESGLDKYFKIREEIKKCEHTHWEYLFDRMYIQGEINKTLNRIITKINQDDSDKFLPTISQDANNQSRKRKQVCY